jgi:hypothetical protein
MEIILAGIADGIVRESSIFEMWFAVVSVVAFSSSAQRFFIALAVAAVALVALRSSQIGYYSGTVAVIAVIALTLWSAIGWGLRVAFVRYVPQSK